MAEPSKALKGLRVVYVHATWNTNQCNAMSFSLASVFCPQIFRIVPVTCISVAHTLLKDLRMCTYIPVEDSYPHYIFSCADGLHFSTFHFEVNVCVHVLVCVLFVHVWYVHVCIYFMQLDRISFPTPLYVVWFHCSKRMIGNWYVCIAYCKYIYIGMYNACLERM